MRVAALLLGLLLLTVFFHFMGWKIGVISAIALLIITSLIVIRLIIAAVVITYRLLFSGVIEKSTRPVRKDK